MATQSVDPKTINTKVTLKVKSGPGEIIGITEKDAVNGEIDFSGIQFSDPGNYVISVIPTSPDLEATEFEINVLPEEEVIPQDDSRDSEPPVTGDRPIIAQIDNPSIQLEPMEYQTQDTNDGNKETADSIGYMPYLYYYGEQIPERDINSMTLYHDGMVPMVQIRFADTKDIIRNNPPLDDSKFEIFLTSGSKNLKSIHLRFKIKDHQKTKRQTYIFIGTLDLDNFYQINFKSYKGTSFKVLQTIAKELKLGYNSNIKDTADDMKWKNTGKKPAEFIYDIVQHSYISDSSFMLGYIDFYWCFNYVDIEKEWTRDISNDVGVNTRSASDLSGKTDESSKIVPLVLTNEAAHNDTNLFISSYVLSNNSTNQSINEGHFTKIKYYDVNKKAFLEFDVDALSTDKDEIMSLKGQPGDKKNFKENFRTKFLGRFDLDNVHENYKYAEIQNRRNLDNLTKISVELNLPQPNFNLYKYQKVKINFVNVKRTPNNEEYIDERISGEWLIVDIKFVWKRGGMMQVIKAVRKELNKTAEELKAGTQPDETVNNSEINENPSEPTENPPNGIYQVGDVYTVRGSKDGKLYQITIQKLSENGKEVVGKIKEI